jgi:Tol biopolymer transport system component
MAHRSALSPDGHFVALVEMDDGSWLPCRLLPFEGASPGHQFGPPDGGCTSAAWSADGTWIYFSAKGEGGRFHIWRQAVSGGKLERLTSGTSEEEGIALASDGHSPITSVGSSESSVWLRDAQGERQISSEGDAGDPTFSPDGNKLYYLVVRHGGSHLAVAGELWATDLPTGRTEQLLPGFSMDAYALSPDGQRVLFAAKEESGGHRLWLAFLDRRHPPQRLLSPVDEVDPQFAPNGDIYFATTEGATHFVYRRKPDGGGREKVLPDSVLGLLGISPDGQWMTVLLADSKDGGFRGTVAYPLDGGVPVTLCRGNCSVAWQASGKFLNFGFAQNTTALVPLATGKILPLLPKDGVASPSDLAHIRGALLVPGNAVASSTAGIYAVTRTSVHRNLYRIPLP